VSGSVCRVRRLLFRAHAFDRLAAAVVVEEEAYAEPVAVEPGYVGPAAAEPGYVGPVAAEPGYVGPVAAESAYAGPVAAEPAYAEPAAVEAYAGPGAEEPGDVEPGAESLSLPELTSAWPCSPTHEAVSWPALVLAGLTADAESTSVLASLGSLAPLAVWSPASFLESALQYCATSRKCAVYFAQAANCRLLLVSDFRPVCSLQASVVPESPTISEHSNSVGLTSGHWAMFLARRRLAPVLVQVWLGSSVYLQSAERPECHQVSPSERRRECHLVSPQATRQVSRKASHPKDSAEPASFRQRTHLANHPE
jgi:hypothetical protein